MLLPHNIILFELYKNIFPFILPIYIRTYYRVMAIMIKPIPIGLFGCGSIARALALHQNRFRIESVYDSDAARLHSFAETYSLHPCSSIQEFLSSPAAVFVEDSSPDLLQTFGPELLSSGTDLVVTSTSSLADTAFRDSLAAAAEDSGAKIHVPSGVVFGLDNIRICQTTPVFSLHLRLTAPPETFGISNAISPCIFSGSVSECAKRYPGQSRTAAAVSAAAGSDLPVEIWADPSVSQIVSELSMAGEFGDVYIRTASRISMKKPDEIPLLALSVIALLENIESPFIIGA